MNAVIKLLLSQGNKINCIKGGGGGGGETSWKSSYRCAGKGNRFLRGQFLPVH